MTPIRSSARHRETAVHPPERRVLETERAEIAAEALLRQGYRFALSLAHDAARAEDLLQDAWVAMLKADGPRTAAYLLTAIRTRFVDEHRRALIAPTESLDAKPYLATEAERDLWNDPCHSVPIKATLERALGLLRPEERAVLLLSAVEGYTAREIGQLLEAPRGTVLSLMHRTRAKMRRWLNDGDATEDRKMTNESHTQPSLRSVVRAYYEDNALPEVTLRRLMTEPRSRSRSARQWVIAGAIAATLAVMALGVGVTGRKLFQPTDAGASVGTEPRLVAVQIHADWCARSPEVGPIFTELLTEYGNEPVLFVTLDITDDVRREQAKLLSSSLGIPQAFEEPFESGMIKLIDREHHTLLAAITGRDEAGAFEARIVEALNVMGEFQRDSDRGGV